MNPTRNEPTLNAVPAANEGPIETATDQSVDFDQSPAPRSGRRRRRLRWIVAVLVVFAVIALWSVLWQPRTISQFPSLATKPPPTLAPQPAAPRYPIEATAAALPPLDASDAAIVAALEALWRGGGVAGVLQPRDVIRNFVVTVDNAPRRVMPVQKLPVKSAAGSFATAGAGNSLVIGESNAQRYAPYVKLLDSVDAPGLVTLYVRHYPLFQQAYREIGYPTGHFNDRLVEVIDLMLAAPDSPASLKLVQPKVFYEFADRDLEQLPAGQKLMLRMGESNAKVVKNRLREIRSLVTVQSPQATAAGTSK